jgi:predicted nucleotide-binding protein
MMGMPDREPPSPDPPHWLKPSLFNTSLAEAQAQLGRLIAAGQRLKDETVTAGDPVPFTDRVNDWRRDGRQWLDTNLGGQAAEELRSVPDYTAEYPWDEILWDGPGNPRRRSRDIASEISILETIVQQLPLWFSSGGTAASTSGPAPPGPSAASKTISTEKGHQQGLVFAENRRAVMVIYGHDREATDAMFGWLRAIGLEPQEWAELVDSSGSGSPYIGDVLMQAFENVQAVVAFFTPDEHVRARDTLPGAGDTWRLQARPNVLIEAGMALVTHPKRTVLVTLGLPDLPSDLAGRDYVRLDGTSERLNDLATRLETAGCDVKRRRGQWLNPDFFPHRDNLASQPRQI